MADDANKVNGAEEAPVKERVKPDPPGYFEGESMTRRRVFTIASQGLGGLAAAGIVPKVCTRCGLTFERRVPGETVCRCC